MTMTAVSYLALCTPGFSGRQRTEDGQVKGPQKVGIQGSMIVLLVRGACLCYIANGSSKGPGGVGRACLEGMQTAEAALPTPKKAQVKNSSMREKEWETRISSPS